MHTITLKIHFNFYFFMAHWKFYRTTIYKITLQIHFGFITMEHSQFLIVLYVLYTFSKHLQNMSTNNKIVYSPLT